VLRFLTKLFYKKKDLSEDKSSDLSVELFENKTNDSPFIEIKNNNQVINQQLHYDVATRVYSYLEMKDISRFSKTCKGQSENFTKFNEDNPFLRNAHTISTSLDTTCYFYTKIQFFISGVALLCSVGMGFKSARLIIDANYLQNQQDTATTNLLAEFKSQYAATSYDGIEYCGMYSNGFAFPVDFTMPLQCPATEDMFPWGHPPTRENCSDLINFLNNGVTDYWLYPPNHPMNLPLQSDCDNNFICPYRPCIIPNNTIWKWERAKYVNSTFFYKYEIYRVVSGEPENCKKVRQVLDDFPCATSSSGPATGLIAGAVIIDILLMAGICYLQYDKKHLKIDQIFDSTVSLSLYNALLQSNLFSNTLSIERFRKWEANRVGSLFLSTTHQAFFSKLKKLEKIEDKSVVQDLALRQI